MLFAKSTFIINIHWLVSHSGHKNSFRMIPVSLVLISRTTKQGNQGSKCDGGRRAEPEETGAVARGGNSYDKKDRCKKAP